MQSCGFTDVWTLLSEALLAPYGRIGLTAWNIESLLQRLYSTELAKNCYDSFTNPALDYSTCAVLYVV